MKFGACLNLLRELTKCVFEGEPCHHINRILVSLPILVRFFAVSIIRLPHDLLLFEALLHVLLISVDYELLIEGWVHSTCLIQLVEGLLLFVQLLNEKVGILDS